MSHEAIQLNHQFQALHVIGLMSGTSTDGLDIISVELIPEDETIRYNILKTKFIPYSDEFSILLKSSPKLSGRALRKLDVDLGIYFGNEVKKFCEENMLNPDLVASHGHTVFHQPDEGYTMQIGCGAAMAASCGYPVVNDFRQGDVSLGGQGAPLVPVGDALLFSEYDYCVNLGGFANISCEAENKRIAWDICPLNVVLNELSSLMGMKYDEGGKIASSGKLIPEMLTELTGLEYYKLPPPKSLGTEWVQLHISPILNRYDLHPVEDKVHTYTMHAARCIAQSLTNEHGKALFSGGGCNNLFLMENIVANSAAKIAIAEPVLRDFKEALIFALLGYLRWHKYPSTIKSVTGASSTLPAGAVFLPKVD